MDLKVLSDDQDVLQLQMVGRVVRSVTTPSFKPIIDLLGERGYARNVLLSLAETEYIDSSGLSWLVVNHRRFKEAGGRLVFHSIPPTVFETMRVMRFDLVLNFANDLDDAMQMLGGEAE